LLENPKNNRLLPLLSLEWTYFATYNDKNIPQSSPHLSLKGRKKYENTRFPLSQE